MFTNHHFCLTLLILCMLLLTGCGQSSGQQTQAAVTQSETSDENASSEADQADILILKQPQSVTVEEQQSFSLNVITKSDIPLRYQWYKNGDPIAGATYPSYAKTTSKVRDEGLYHVVIYNERSSLKSFSASVRVTPENTPLSILEAPRSQTVTQGQAARLSVRVSGSSPLIYQWYKNGYPLSGSNSDTYLIPASRKSDAGYYHVIVSNPFSSIESPFASLVVYDESLPPDNDASEPPETPDDGMSDAPVSPVIGAPDDTPDEVKSEAPASDTPFGQLAPSITKMPRHQQLIEGERLQLSVTVAGADSFRYQWFKNDQAIPGAIQASFTKTNSSILDAGRYHVLVSTAHQRLTSQPAVIQINPKPQPLRITQPPSGKTITQGDPLLLRVEVSGDGPYSYQWQKNGSLIPNATHSSFYIPLTRTTDQGSYRVIVSNPLQSQSSEFVNVWITAKISPVSINTQPQSQLLSPGTSTKLTVNASGGGFITYQWRKNGEAIPQATSASLSLFNLELDDAGYYDVVVANSQGSRVSQPAYVDIFNAAQAAQTVSIDQHPVSHSIFPGDSFYLSVGATSENSLNFQWFLNGKPIPGATSALYHVSQAETRDVGSYSVLVSDTFSSQRSQTANIVFYEPVGYDTDHYAIELTWDTPRSREDGSPLEAGDILEYVIEYGYDDSQIDQRITVPHQVVNSYILDGIQPGRLFLRIATVDTDGFQGSFSDPISLFIDAH
jgi:hypothetical protein